MGTPSSATEVEGTQSQKMLQIVALFATFVTSFGAPGYGHIGYHPAPCVKELETIKATACKLVPEKTCSTETVKIGEKITGFEKGECKEIEVCKPVNGDVSKDIESCTEVAKEVCEEVDKVVPKVTC